ncbi:hypothetical protein OUZ56_012174 [Daphnia magna]|uniref:Uncharacterized protein n=1 Tax=Daphnia magna TaxID=35525 RepID=A0ABQ9Z297_9CRUS|nr:hypothetical protein OUZ56_012174 [Daphnia magna]
MSNLPREPTSPGLPYTLEWAIYYLLLDDTSITICQPLVNSLLDAIHLRFDQMFSDNELRLATITNPMLKLSWLEKEEDIERAKSLLTCEYKRLQGIQCCHSLAYAIDEKQKTDVG